MNNKYDSVLHYNLAFIGGFLGIYCILQRSDFLGAAQTSNMIYLVSHLLGKDYIDVLLRAGAMILYAFSISLTVLIPAKTTINIKTLSILIDAVAVGIMGVMPDKMNAVLGLYPVFFAMAFQWNTFKGAKGYISSSIFSTNNLRQFSISLTNFGMTKKKEHIDRAKFYGLTILSFHVGVAVSYIAWQKFLVHSVLFCFIPIISAFIINLINDDIENLFIIQEERKEAA